MGGLTGVQFNSAHLNGVEGGQRNYGEKRKSCKVKKRGPHKSKIKKNKQRKRERREEKLR